MKPIGPTPVALLTLGACSAPMPFMGHTPPPADWPEMDVKVCKVPHAEMRTRCERLTGSNLGDACAAVYMPQQVCVIWMSEEFYSGWQEEHERQHCAGKDHIGSSAFRDAWEAWKKKNPDWRPGSRRQKAPECPQPGAGRA